mgnify:CR=1 FL=1
MRSNTTFKILFFFSCILLNFSLVQAQNPQQTLRGQVFDAVAQKALSGATVLLEGSSNGTSTDEQGKFRFENSSRIQFPAVGDWVAATMIANEAKAMIHAVLPRKSLFSRKAVGEVTEEQPVAANIDTVFIIMGLDSNFNLRRIERYLSLAWESGALPVIVLNKSDLCPEAVQRTHEVEAVAAGADVHTLSALDPANIASLRKYFEPGRTIAFLGSSGVGKSTIINLLNRFYEINSGEISIDNRNINEYTLESLRKQIAIVLQDVFLFSGSILDNITLKNPAITEAQVIAASKLVGAHTFIMELPNGYQHNVMERGSTLSVGQRQLISFIRALIYNPQILILDEATSSIDTESENLIQHAIETLVKGRTSIVIAHRLSTIQNADKIMVLEHGEIKELDTHEELLKREDGYYKKLYEMQFQKEHAH